MKDKIKELAYQAGIQHRLDIPSKIWGYDENLEKFSELIIQECIDQCLSVTGIEHYGTLDGFIVDECSKRIRNHFGVK